jgi:hypothetical protein
MNIKTNVKAGEPGLAFNHNESLKIKTNIKAGGSDLNHNESFRR